ncbi:alginate O-acetyltransferase AlgX-related protein [Devosia psychrophila]|uniref:SGNH hydrolase-like domain-containing protein, acetyltransferase AlgX n=1 Tax=Devosia psychrophila TaxID=728005 RepID=A0A0F5PZX5_9HYPH|nr:hypothetical protein [Devosia psychrophila]KKC33951.1 hypothetical protein WH91_05695 [Devosia psychrophila]SFD18012.1 SGNH hydrolase-like domain-containing protein, acetyltransferase AlgX [Devosia psychrophila]
MSDLKHTARLSLIALALALGQSLLAQPTVLAASNVAAAATPFTCDFRPSNEEAAFDVVPGKAGLFFRRDTDLEEFFELTPEAQHSFQQLVAALRVRGTDLVFVPLPPRGLVQYQYLDDTNLDQALYDRTFALGEFKRYIEQLRGAGVTVVDLLAKVEADDLWDNFYYLRDHHWTTTGAHAAAAAVADALAALPSVASLSTYAFTTEQTGDVARKSPMGFEIQRRCGAEIPAEMDVSYATTRAAATADDLLGLTAKTPAIALVGSSFSAGQFHFADFISQESSLEVANYAIDGAEFVGSLASLVFSRNFVEVPPPAIVWEAPSYYNINLELFSAVPQLLPAIYGPCAEDETIASSGQVNVGDKTQVLSFGEADAITGDDFYLYIDGPEMGDTPVSVTLRYSDGDYYTASLGEFSRFVRDGRYFLQLNDEFEASLLEVAVETPTPSTLTAKLCSVPAAFANIGDL